MTNSFSEYDVDAFVDMNLRNLDDGTKIIIKNLKKLEIISWVRILLSRKFRQIFPSTNAIKQKLNERDLQIFEELFIMNPLNFIYWRDGIKTGQLFHPTDQKSNPFAWSHAIATIIHLMMRRIIGLNAPSFNEIKTDLINMFGKNPPVLNVLTQFLQLPKYKIIHFQEVTEKQVYPFISNSTYHLFLCCFYLTGEQWNDFANFYNDQNENKVLTKEDLSITQPHEKFRDNCGGHAVVAVDADDATITYLNSWGEDWGDNGKFTVQRGALPSVHYYDFFYTAADLTEEMKSCYRNRKERAIEAFYKIYDNISALPMNENVNKAERIMIEFCEDFWNSSEEIHFRNLDLNEMMNAEN